MEELLKRSDIVSLHCPLTADTKGMIGKDQLALMKKSALLINTARGGVLDSAALADALEKGEIAGAACDVFETEPPLPTVEIPINFDYLKGENEDIIGWIVVDGTLIDYPILYDTTYNYYYLNHNYEGTSTGYGSIFVLGENAGDFTDFNTVVYGHNMLDGRMFAQLHRFRDKNFFDSHGQIIVYTPERQLTYQVFAAYRRDNLDIIANTDFSTKALIDEYIESVYAQTDLAQFNPALEVTSSDRIITLSTCIGNPAYRFVVQGVLVDEAQAVFAGTPDADGE